MLSKGWVLGVMALLAGLTGSRAAADDKDVAAGKMAYQNTCGGCHSVDEDRIGPRHRNVVGRPVASIPGFDYSDALKMLGGVWTPQRLDQWLSGTQKMAPGSKMYLELDDPNQRRLIIAYLESVSMPDAKAPPTPPTPEK
jgi:cytochrome c